MENSTANTPFPHSEYVFNTPPPPEWSVEVVDGVLWHPDSTKKVPNAFHRLMQRLVFGFKWKRL